MWAFFQAKTIRMTVLRTAAEQMQIEADRATDADVKARLIKTIDSWKKTAARYDDEPSTRTKAASSSPSAPRRPSTSATRLWRAIINYEFASAAFQIGIVLASAQVITGMVVLGWLSGLLGLVGLASPALGLWAPHAWIF